MAHESPYTRKMKELAQYLQNDFLSENIPDNEKSRDGQDMDISSETFIRINQLLAKKQLKRRLRKVSLRIVSIAMALLIGVGTWMTVDSGSRASTSTWIRKVCRKSVLYKSEVSAQLMTSVKTSVYELGWIPEGFVWVDESYGDGYKFCSYKEESGGQSFCFYYADLNLGSSVYLFDFSRISESEELTVCGSKADYYPCSKDLSSNNLVWIIEKENTIFTISGTIGKDAMVKIAENLVSK